MGGGLVEATEFVPEFLDESAPLLVGLVAVFVPLELLVLVLFLRAHGGRSVCCGGVGGAGPG